MTSPAVSAYSPEKGEEEHILDLGNGRQMAYCRNGPLTARTVIIFFSGLFSVGNAREVPEPCRAIGALWICPTLPGMGNSSSRAAGEAYHTALAKDMSALLSHLYPTNDFDRLYLEGGSYGTVQAQMLYGAPYEVFPAGRKIAGCIVLAGMSPFKYHVNYAKSLNWQNWVSVGPPSQIIPFHLLQRLVSAIIALKFKTLDGAKDFLAQVIFSKMDDDEQKKMAAWLESKGRTKDQFVEQMAKGAITSSKRWDGFLEVSDVLHSDWGFEPAKLDEEHASKPMLVVGSEKDDIGGSTNDWVVANYKSATLRVFPGGHISSVYYQDEMWKDFIDSYSPQSSN